MRVTPVFASILLSVDEDLFATYSSPAGRKHACLLSMPRCRATDVITTSIAIARHTRVGLLTNVAAIAQSCGKDGGSRHTCLLGRYKLGIESERRTFMDGSGTLDNDISSPADGCSRSKRQTTTCTNAGNSNQGPTSSIMTKW
jgi:hypothetical protein